jgi:hypothetical protein
VSQNPKTLKRVLWVAEGRDEIRNSRAVRKRKVSAGASSESVCWAMSLRSLLFRSIWFWRVATCFQNQGEEQLKDQVLLTCAQSGACNLMKGLELVCLRGDVRLQHVCPFGAKKEERVHDVPIFSYRLSFSLHLRRLTPPIVNQSRRPTEPFLECYVDHVKLCMRPHVLC